MVVLWTGDGGLEVHVGNNEVVGGLCGDNDGDKYNDLNMIDGLLFVIFV